MGLFDSCQEQGKEHAENIVRPAAFVEEFTNEIHRCDTEYNENFFLTSKKLGALRNVQENIIKLQNCTWAIIEDQFDIFATSIHIFRNCDQILFSRQQVTFNYDSISSLLFLAFSKSNHIVLLSKSIQ